MYQCSSSPQSHPASWPAVVTCSPSLRELKQCIPEMMQRWLFCSDPASSKHRKCILSQKPRGARTWTTKLSWNRSRNVTYLLVIFPPDLNQCSLPNHSSHRRTARPLLKEARPAPSHTHNELSHAPTEETYYSETLWLVESIKFNISQNPP